MLKHYISAARLRTLPLSISGIIMGCGLAYNSYNYNWLIVCFAILATVCFQILSNFANDYGDGVKGTDINRVGEQRLVSSGLISPVQMKFAIKITVILSITIALLLLYIAFDKNNFLYAVLFFGLGVLSIVAAIKYTVGKNAYGYSGFGDIFVFLFFGLLSTLGSYFLITKQFDSKLILPAISIGTLSVAVLNLNNMRDQIQDKKSNKNTLVVKLGSQKAKLYHYSLFVIALITSVSYVMIDYKSPLQFLFLIAFIPIILNTICVAKNIIFSELDSELKKVALSTFLFALLFSVFN